MSAARLHRLGDPLRIESIPTPQPGPGQVVVQVHACGVCHTDVHACRGDWRAQPTLPLTPGHEIIGDVVACGSGVSEGLLGARVGVFWLNGACQACEYCLDGWESLCPRQINTGFGVAGGFAEYVCVQSDFAVPVPPSLDPNMAAPLLCAGVSAYKAIRETELLPGASLGIIGCGGVGHLAVAYAKAAGLRVVALDRRDTPLSLALAQGADDAIDVRDADALRRLKKSGGLHGVLVTAASVDAIRLGIDLLRRKGIAVIVGLPAGDALVPVFDVVVKRFTIRGSIGGCRDDVAATLEIAMRRSIRPHVEIRKLVDANEALAAVEAGNVLGRVVLTMT